MIKSLYIISIIPIVFGAKFRFDNYTLYKVLPKNLDQVNLLRNLQLSDDRYDFWSDPMPSAESVTILSSPKDRSDIENILKTNNVDFIVTMENIQEAIEKETVKTYMRNDVRNMTWDAYYTLEAINSWIDNLAETYPNVVSVIIGGMSYEGRQIKGLKISHGEGRKIIFLEGGIHSREWISPATVNFITNELLTSRDPEIMAAARDFDWYIFPVTNPDGYIWTHEQFRMWRKNRRPITGTAIGTDLNRNWNNNWFVVGSSSNPNADTYAGPGPFSEPETRSLSNYLMSIGDKIDIYLSFHSFGQMLLLPFGNTTEPLANYDDAMKIGRRAMGALSVRYGTVYRTGNIAEIIYQASGGSIDWVKEHLKVPLVYCYELRDNGTFGFFLPPNQILPTSLETMDSIVELILQARRFGYLSAGNGLTASLVLVLVALLAKFF